ncbi:Mu transposase C-terminal domain-containing protein [Paenibacillus sedimenti]|uniref:Mu transposase C-terminal domain-containing protein n=1 Tax=Paenibacillus sedimenti TaxID=2770274 RepID=A0A926QLQ1_9BACL|nr:Mu transposase C-terminal domain-containing protein [Paenibacillus sedimenti]MBD0383875.1 Mu transposase C-terminal domain-containing protein [Paenibacillus sedimenti]
MRFFRGEKRNGENIRMQKDIKRVFDKGLDKPQSLGNRPFEKGYIENTLLDMEIVCSKTNKILGRPWVTLLTDEYSKKAIAVNLSMDPPSHVSCLMVLRECIKKHSRLPETIVLDNEKEFYSEELKELCAICNCTVLRKPKTICRHEVINLNTANFLYSLPRISLKEWKPNTVRYSLEDLCGILNQWFDDTCDGKKPTFDMTAKEIVYNGDFEILTCPRIKGGKRVAMPEKGVRVNNIFYSSHEFENQIASRNKVEVKFDPQDIKIAYAKIHNKWIKLMPIKENQRT